MYNTGTKINLKDAFRVREKYSITVLIFKSN